MAKKSRRRGSGLGHTRSGLYRAARLLGDLNALEEGPEALAKRLVRRTIYREVFKALRRLLPELF